MTWSGTRSSRNATGRQSQDVNALLLFMVHTTTAAHEPAAHAEFGAFYNCLFTVMRSIHHAGVHHALTGHEAPGMEWTTNISKNATKPLFGILDNSHVGIFLFFACQRSIKLSNHNPQRISRDTKAIAFLFLALILNN